MATRGYLVFSRSDTDDATATEDMRFVKDGFSWPALLLPLPWIVWRRMWLTLVWYVVWLMVVAWTGRLLGEPAGTALGILGGILLAFEASEIRRRSLLAKGWRELGPVAAGSRAEAELRIVAGQLAAPQPVSPLDRRERAIRDPSLRWDREPEVLGLFPEPERP